MPEVNGWELVPYELDNITATDLYEEAERVTEEPDGRSECFGLFDMSKRPPNAQMIYFPDRQRAGIAWGADAVWTDCQSAEEAVLRWSEGEMVE